MIRIGGAGLRAGGEKGSKVIFAVKGHVDLSVRGAGEHMRGHRRREELQHDNKHQRHGSIKRSDLDGRANRDEHEAERRRLGGGVDA